MPGPVKRILLAVSFLAFFSVQPAFAAELFLSAGTTRLQEGQVLRVEVLIDSEGEELNAVEGQITFPHGLLTTQGFNDAGSLLSFWIEKPAVVGEGVISFSGIIPGGHVTKRGFLFSATFLANRPGQGALAFRNVRALRNDGRGTAVPINAPSLRLSVVAAPTPSAPTVPAKPFDAAPVPAAPVPIAEEKDTEPPEPFKPLIASDARVFEGRTFVVFSTQDKGSGMDHYEVCEGARSCVKAESPYVLEDQGRQAEIIIAAVDRQGNRRTAVLPAAAAPFGPPTLLIGLLAGLVAALCWLFLRVKAWRARRKMH